MTEIRHEMNGLLVAQLDTLDDLIRQRDSARRWAAEMIRRVDMARIFANQSFLMDTDLRVELIQILDGDL